MRDFIPASYDFSREFVGEVDWLGKVFIGAEGAEGFVGRRASPSPRPVIGTSEPFIGPLFFWRRIA
jgi:hypothetical protein